MPKYIDVTKYSGCALVPVYLSEDGFAGFEKVDNLAPTDVQEVKHGKWILGELDGEWRCNVCCRYAIGNIKPIWKYCPNCGARMDGEGK